MFGKIKPLFLVSVLFLAAAGMAGGLEDYKTRIAVVPMVNNTGDTQYDALCTTVTDTVGLVLQFLKDYLVFTEDEIPEIAQLEQTGPETLNTLGREEGLDEIIFGSAELREEGGFLFTLSIFNTYEGAVQVRETAEAESIFDIFDAADNITMALIAQVSDIHIGFGAIDLRRGEGYGTFEVYLDDKPVRNYERVFRRVLNGGYLLSVHQERLLGDTVVFEKAIEVYENKTTSLSFDIPGASEKEFRYLETEGGKLLDLAEDPENIEQFLSGIADFQRKTRRTGYDARLEERRNEILKTAGTTAVEVLEELKQQGDGLYYRQDPDFSAAFALFSTISDLLNNIFHYTFIDDEELNIQLPVLVRTAGDEGFFTFDGGEEGLKLRSFTAGGKQKGELSFPVSVEDFSGDMCTDVYGKLYLFNPPLPEITVYDGNLNVFARHPVPDFEPEGSTDYRLARAESGLLYIIGPGRAVVFDPAAEAPDEAEGPVPYRRKEIEEKITEKLDQEDSFPLSSAFFDTTDRLLLFSAQAEKCLRFDELGNFHSVVSFPDAEESSNLTVDSLGYFYLTLPNDSVIRKYGPDGEFVTQFGEFGEGAGEFSRAADCSVSDNGTVYVADTYNYRIQILELASPPVLVPEVSRYGVQFRRRERIAGEALEKLAETEEQIRPGPAAGRMIGSGIAFGGTAGLAFLTDFLRQEYLSTYIAYREASDGGAATALHAEADIRWYLGLTADIAQFSSFGTAAMLLTSGALELINNAGMRKRTIRDLQSLSLEKDYVLDRDKYKGLRRARGIGIWTGTMPVLAGAAALGVYRGLAGSDADPLVLTAIAAGSVALPPIWGHLYGGTFHGGLFTAGLAADAMAAAALIMAAAAGPEGHAGFNRELLSEDVTLKTTFKNIGERLPIYLMVGAMCTRLAAGIWDANHAWIRAHEHNRYRADTRGTVPSVTVVPVITVREQYGLSMRVSF